MLELPLRADDKLVLFSTATSSSYTLLCIYQGPLFYWSIGNIQYIPQGSLALRRPISLCVIHSFLALLQVMQTWQVAIQTSFESCFHFYNDVTISQVYHTTFYFLLWQSHRSECSKSSIRHRFVFACSFSSFASAHLISYPTSSDREVCCAPLAPLVPLLSASLLYLELISWLRGDFLQSFCTIFLLNQKLLEENW